MPALRLCGTSSCLKPAAYYGDSSGGGGGSRVVWSVDSSAVSVHRNSIKIRSISGRLSCDLCHGMVSLLCGTVSSHPSSSWALQIILVFSKQMRHGRFAGGGSQQACPWWLFGVQMHARFCTMLPRSTHFSCQKAGIGVLASAPA